MLLSNVFGQENVQMATGFYSEGKIYVVISVLAIIFSGIIFYLVKTEMKIKKIEAEIKNK